MSPLVTASQPASPARYPTLSFIDAARGDLLPRFADAPCAEQLEARARRLTAAYWSDHVWITGTVPATCFQRVCEELERLANGYTGRPARNSAA